MAQYSVPENILDKLRCSLCFEILSYPPIIYYADSGTVCGRCPMLEPEKNIQPFREKNYEVISTFLNFPCRYKFNGCDFSLPMQHMPEHEASCEFKPFFCPVLPLGCCPWQGSPKELYPHYAMTHQEFLIETGTVRELDTVSNYKEHHLLPQIGNLFIFRAEYQNSDKIFRFNLHYIGNSEMAKKYEYQVSFQTRSGDSNYKYMKKVVEPDTNLQNRINECSIPLSTLLELLNHPTFIMYYIEVSEIETEAKLVKLTIQDESELKMEENEIPENVPQIENKLFEEFECPVCQEFMIAQIYQCEAGHSFCQNCKPKLRDCPTCRKNIGNIRNFALETIAERIKFPCKYNDLGCFFQAFPADLLKHANDCSFKPSPCVFHDYLNCNWLGNINALYDHCLTKHKNYIFNKNYETNYNSSCDRFETFLIKQEYGHLFRIRYYYDQNVVMCTVQLISTPKGDSKFMYEVHVDDCNKSNLLLTSRKYCGLLTDHKDCVKHCTTWNLDMVKQLISNDHNKFLKFKCLVYKFEK